MEDILQQWGLWGLFASALISSTLAPGGSEALFVALLMQEFHPPLTLLLIATLGNTLGGWSSWLIGRLIASKYPAERLTNAKHNQAVAKIRRWGSPVLLLSWLPLVGDPLCVAAGWLRINMVAALCFIAIGKAMRYAALWWLVI